MDQLAGAQGGVGRANIGITTRVYWDNVGIIKRIRSLTLPKAPVSRTSSYKWGKRGGNFGHPSGMIFRLGVNRGDSFKSRHRRIAKFGLHLQPYRDPDSPM